MFWNRQLAIVTTTRHLKEKPTFLQHSLKLIRHTQNHQLMKNRLRLTLRHPELPTPPVLILGFFPDWLHALPEDMHAVSHAHLVPWVVVVDAVEGGDVGDIFVEDV